MRNKIVAVIAWMLLMAAGVSAQTGNRLTVGDVIGGKGSTVLLDVSMENTAGIVAVEFTLDMPEGVTLITDKIMKTERLSSHIVSVREVEHHRYKFILMSPNNDIIKGSTGSLFAVAARIGSSLAVNSSWSMTISDAVLSVNTGENVLTETTAGVVHISEIPGLVIKDVSIDKQTVTPGERIVASWQVTNSGDLPFEGGWSEQVSLVTEDKTVSKVLATMHYNDALSADGVVSRQTEILLPELLGIDGRCWVEVRMVPKVDAALATAKQSDLVTINKVLSIKLTPTNLEENAGGKVMLKMSRSGRWTMDETFNLTATADSRLSVPETITIPEGQSGTVVYLTVTDNDVVDDSSDVTLSVEGNDYPAAVAHLTIEDNEYPDLQLTASKSVIAEGETFQLTIMANHASSEPLTVTLTSENDKRFTYPRQVTIPAGQTTVTVDVTAKDDDLPSEALSNVFTASASRFHQGEVVVLLEDDDMPVLELTLTPNKIAEGAGPVSVAGTLRRTGVTTNKITVRLSDDSNGGLYFGTRQFVLNKGVEEVNFNFGPIDNAQVDGDRQYTVTAAVWLSSCSCSATGESVGSVSATLEVLDDDGPALTLTSSLSTIKEGGTAILTVGRNTLVGIDQPLAVHLSSDYDDNLSYEHIVTIPAGQQTAQVKVTSTKNDVNGDTHTAVFTVQAEGFASATCYLMVTDQTLPDAVITGISLAESEVEAESMANISVTVMNVGQAVLPSQTHINIYVVGDTEALRTLYTQEELNPGESTTITRQVKMTTVPGNKRLHAVVNEEKQVAELSYNNNTSLPTDVCVTSPYRITIQSDKSRYLPGETALLSGSVTGSLSANAEIEVYVINDGLRQTMTVTTDNEGKFLACFTPYERQIGHFVVGACYPGEGLAEKLTEFDVIGLRRTTQEYITCEVLIGTPYQGVITIENLGRIAQSNIRVELLTTNENCVAHFGKINQIRPNEIAELSYSLEASSPSPGSDWERLKVRVISDEGATTDIIIYYYCTSPSANLVANVDEINTTVSIGAVKEYPLTITNKGAGDTGVISLALPSYITSQSVMSIPSLKQDESVTIILKINTMDGMQVNVPISGSLGVNCENANGLCVPYTIVPVSDSKGKLVIDVCDEYTYYTPLAPHVANANVRICRPITNELICEGLTDSDGLYKVELPEGYYLISVKAEKHESYQNYVLVDASKENATIVNLSYDGGIKVSWDVVETEVEDEYQIQTTISYETNVPTPVLILDMPESIPANELRVGESLLFNAMLTNKGMIAIYEAQLILPSGLETLSFENVGSGPVTLSPQQSIIFPIKVTRIAPTNNSRREVNAVGEKKSDIPCTEAVIPIGYWNCGVDKKWYRHEGVTLNLGSLCPPSDLNGDGGGDRSEWPLYGRLSGANFNPYIPNIPTIFPEIHHNIKGCDPCLQSQVLTIVDCGLSTASKAYKAIKGVVSCLTSIYDVVQTIHDGKSDKQKKLGAIIEASAVCGSALSSPKGGSRLSEAITSILYTLDETAGRFMQGKEMDWDYTVDMLGDLADGLAKLTEFEFECFKEIACPLKLLKPCEDGRKTTRAQYLDSRMGEAMSLPSMVQDNVPSYIQEYKRSISYGVVEMLAIIGIKKELFGDDEWFLADAEELTVFYMKFNSLLNMDGSFPISNMGELLGSKPDNLNSAQIESFIQRWNNSLSDDGIDNRVNIEKAMSYFELINEVQKQVNSLGYPSVAECAEEAYKRVMDNLEKSDDNVCASVTLEIEQVMTLTRPAYRGTLTVFNGHDSAAMTDARLNLVVRDENENVVTAREFQINAESLDGFEGEIDLSSGWTLNAQQTGIATILFIPTKYAAPTEPMQYSFGGTLAYLDPFTGLEVTRDLFPITLTVNPLPDLELTYLMQRDVYGDDPLTVDVVEPVEPAEFALIIDNKGYGEAKNVRMLTEQPEITESDKDLLINFQLIRSQVNGERATLSFGQSIANDFGTIPAHSQVYAQWWLVSSLLGHFTSYEVAARHVSSYGNQDLSLVDTVTIHEMVHGFTPLDYEQQSMDNKKRGWLVNDIVDADDMPDVVYFSDATQQTLNMSTGAISKNNETEYKLTVNPSVQGWNYGSIIDPTKGKQKLAKIVRQSDGIELPIDNIWQTDRTLRDAQDWLYENRLHFVGDIPADGESFILTFEPKPKLELAVENYVGVPEGGTVLKEQLTTVTVKFNKSIKTETFTTEDITLHCQGVKQDASQIIIEKQNEQEYKLILNEVTLGDGYYVLAVQTAGIEDQEGFCGTAGKQATWIQYVDGKVALHVAASPAEGGTVSPASGRFDYDSDVAMVATAAEGYDFMRWTNGSQTVSEHPAFSYHLTAETKLTAQFQLKHFEVTIDYDEAQGKVTGAGTGIYDYGTVLTLTAVAAEGYQFDGWLIDGEVAAEDVTLTLTVKDKTVVIPLFSELPTATLSGVVAAASNDMPISDATITLTCSETIFTTTTDLRGRYEIEVADKQLTYDVRCVADGYIDGPDISIDMNNGNRTQNFYLLRGATVRLPDDGICTFSATVPLRLPNAPNALTAYYAKTYTGESVSMGQAEGDIAVNEGLILVGTPNERIDLSEASTANAIEDNLLRGTAFEPYRVETSDIYVLANKTGETKFHRAAVGLTIPREKAYLELDYPSQANALRIIWDESTLVEMIKANMPNVSETSFDLLGRPTKDGGKGKKAIKVKKGKKTVMK